MGKHGVGEEGGDPNGYSLATYFPTSFLSSCLILPLIIHDSEELVPPASPLTPQPFSAPDEQRVGKLWADGPETRGPCGCVCGGECGLVLTGSPRDPDGHAAGPVPSGRGGPDVDNVALLDGQPQLGRRPVCAEHPQAALAARPVEHLERQNTLSMWSQREPLL